MSTSYAPIYESLSALIDYPTDQTGARLAQTLHQVNQRLPGALPRVREWQSYFEANPIWSVQELYTHTFDLTPVCSLDVGYYLFGEDYQRGMFMVRMRECLEAVGIEGEGELPDHLPVVLRWLARTDDAELRRDMLAECLLPVLRKMDQALIPLADTEKSEGGGVEPKRENPYRGLLQVVPLVLEADLEELGAPAEPDAVAAGGGGAR